MSCLITRGRSIGCKDGIGGLYKVFFANQGLITPVLDADGIITNLSSGSSVYQYELNGVSSKLVQEMVSSKELGTTMVTQTLTLDLRSVDALTNNEIKLLAYGRPEIYVQDNLGKVWLCGKLRGMDLTTGNLDFGDQLNSKYGYVLTFVGQENEYANWLSGSTFASPFGAFTATPAIVVGT